MKILLLSALLLMPAGSVEQAAAQQARVPAAAWEPLPPPPAEAYRARRERVMNAMTGGGIAVLVGGPQPTRDERFVQENNFYYLTGVDAQGAMLILDADARTAQLFLPVLSAQQRMWEGSRMEPGSATVRATGIEAVYPRTAFDSVMTALLARAPKVWAMHTPPELPPGSASDATQAWAGVTRDPWLQDGHANAAFTERVRARKPDVVIGNLSPIVLGARTIKDSYEQTFMRRTGLLGALGVAEAIRSTRPGYTEWEIAAAATFVQDGLGETMPGFTPVIASGPNTNTIHHLARNRRTEAGDVILLDYGSNYGHYTSDVTRTWPVSGRFTSEQLAYYETVRMIRDSVLAAMRPGVTLGSLRDIGERIATARGHADVSWSVRSKGRYLGHPVGMSAHDPGPLSDSTRLLPGMVWNLEPVIDIPQRGWHFRIEDGVLITDTGIEVLTSAVPVDPVAIERLYDETGVVEWWKQREGAITPPAVQAVAPNEPPPRSWHSSAYDTGRDRLLVYGGNAARGAAADTLGTMWEWDGSAWHGVNAAGPGPRDDVALVYDAAQRRTLMFGGRHGDRSFDDLWSWDGARWTRLAEHGPGPRHLTAVAFDDTRNELIVHGGHDVDANVMKGDTWSWGVTGWRRINGADLPPRFAAALALDPVSGSMILHGGYTEGGPIRETWKLMAGKWERLPVDGPLTGVHRSLVTDAAGKRMLLAAAEVERSTQPLTIWEFNKGTWQRIGAGPAWRAGYSVAYDPRRSRLLIFGGEMDSRTKLADLWKYDSNGLRELRADGTARPEP